MKKINQQPHLTGAPLARLWVALQIAAIVLLCCWVYFGSLQNGFVGDDNDQILENPLIRDFKHIPEILFKGVWSFEGLKFNEYRPILFLSFMLDYHFFGLDPWGYHLVNLIFHIGVCILVLYIIRQLLHEWGGSSKWLPAFIAAALFSVHPVHTETVLWVSDFTDLSYTFFYLLAFYVFIKTEAGGGGIFKRGYLLSALFFLLSMLCKETALTLLLVLLCYDYLFNKNRTSSWGNFTKYIPYLVSLAVYFCLRLAALGSVAPNTSFTNLTGYQFALNAVWLFGRYIHKLLIPVELGIGNYYTFQPVETLFQTNVLAAVFITIVFLVFAIIAFKKDKLIFLAFLFITAPVLPVLYIYGLNGPVFAVRYLYLPSFGFVLLVAVAVDRASGKNARRTLAVFLTSVIVMYSYLSFSRVPIWRDDYTFCVNAINTYPGAPKPHYGLGRYYQVRGKLDEAVEQYKIAISLDPTDKLSLINMAAAYADKGMLDEAIEVNRAVIRLDPGDAASHYNLGVDLYKKGLKDSAIPEFKEALTLWPDFSDAHLALGLAYLDNGQLDSAIAEFLTVTSLRPDDYKILNTLGVAYLRKGNTEEAINKFEAALRLNPSFQQARANLDLARKISPGN